MIPSEARFTPPRDDCPHPEWWHSTDDDSTEVEVSILVGALVRALQPELVVETGSAWGQTSLAIGAALEANGHGRLVTCEPDPVRWLATVARVDGLPVTVYAVPSDELLAAADVYGQRVGFAWLDSLIHLRLAEFDLLRPVLSSGAIVGFHDTGPQHGYRDEVEAIPGTRSIYLPTPRGVSFVEVA